MVRDTSEPLSNSPFQMESEFSTYHSTIFCLKVELGIKWKVFGQSQLFMGIPFSEKEQL